MPEQDVFTPDDVRWLEQNGLDTGRLMRQIAAFKKGPRYAALDRPATVDDGIQGLPETKTGPWMDRWEQAAAQGRLMVFVPASGAATRMFQDLLSLAEGEPLSEDAWRRVRGLFASLRNLALYDDLETVMREHQPGLDTLLAKGAHAEILPFMLSEQGLNLSAAPKALIPFHRYKERSRTAFEEHLFEACLYVRDRNALCRLHFTLSPEHLDRTQAFYEEIRPYAEDRCDCTFQVTLSIQDPATSTLAVDMDNRPVRLENGTPLLRPGGHGALLQNLESTGGDVVFIKNVDNVVPDRYKETTLFYKKLLGGLLLELQETQHAYVRTLSTGTFNETDLEAVRRFAVRDLHLPDPPEWDGLTYPEKASDLLVRLDRPLRVCGVVENVGEPGGGPFWARRPDGTSSLQIVEYAEVDPGDPHQQRVFRSSTHFNPVDIVCGLRDAWGRPFALDRFVDPDAVFISRKKHAGKPLKALEMPGLWNGSMAGWITVFVEVPLWTFNPVKRVNDLLRERHQG